ncbi:MAG: TolC family protein [Parachlamydiaceae bacterium]|nr:TolC family protein [Parachlamydiaceae bacterium]
MTKLQVMGITSLLSLFVSSCTHVPRGSKEQVAGIVQERIGKEVVWNQSGYEDPCITNYIQDLTFQPITVESAIQIAVLNNPKIQATIEEIGIAQADLVEAGLFTNPAFSIEVRYPYLKKLNTNIEYLITATFLDIFMIPLRTRLATAELEQVKRRVANEILDLAFDVRKTFYELLAEQQKLKYTKSIVELTSIQGEIVSRQNRVGNVNSLDFQQVQSRFLEAKLEISQEQSEIIRLKEKLNRLLGLSEDICLILPENIPQEIDYQGFDICALESIAIEERLDLQEARFEVIRIRRMLGLKDWWTYTNLNTGVTGERDPDGLNLVGFGVSGEIPIFNFGQAARMRIFAQLRQAQDRYVALEIQILSEVREFHKLLMSDLGMINDYRVGILPLQNKVISSSEELYNVMGLGVDRLLENKRQELEANRNYLEILKDYWVARVHLDKALGGYLFRLLNQDGCIEGAAE